MQENKMIERYFNISNYIVLCQMYLDQYLESKNINEHNFKKNNPGHLGTSLSLNFIQANLNFFLNKNNLTSKLVVGAGHGGVSLIANLFLNGTLQKYYPNYSLDRKGLNNLIQDFGLKIRSEINPEYPETIYDGGELGYSLGVAYGFAIDSEIDIVPCIIGDGEAETGTICSAWQLNKLLKTRSKVLPIINLNGLKMNSRSFLSNFSNEELINYYSLLGYQPAIVDARIDNNILSVIEKMQDTLKNALHQDKPLIIFKSKKGFTLPNLGNIIFEDSTIVHKNPLQKCNSEEKLETLRCFLKKYETDLFDNNNKICLESEKFKPPEIKDKDLFIKKIFLPQNKNIDNISMLEDYLLSYIKNNDLKIFSPDELFSNMLGKLNTNAIEILNENLLQALYQGYVQAGNNGLYVSYEGFMPIIISMVAQYYKYLKQKKILNKQKDTFSMNYLLTSTCYENTYSHQNPEFVNTLLQRNDEFYSIFYPKDGTNLIKCMEESLNSKNKINVIITSKRHQKKYQNYNQANLKIDTIIECSNPELILCATGDYMLDNIMDVYSKLKDNYKNIKIIYVTNPKCLDINSINALSEIEFSNFFKANVPIIYLFSGYSNTIKGLIYERNVECDVFGYNDQISKCGYLKNNLEANNISSFEIERICLEKLSKNKNKVLRRLPNE